MGGVWGLVGFGVSMNDVVYYLDGGVFGLVRLDLEVGVWFWVRYGDVISGWLLHGMPCTTYAPPMHGPACPSSQTPILPHPTYTH